MNYREYEDDYDFPEISNVQKDRRACREKELMDRADHECVPDEQQVVERFDLMEEGEG